MNRRIDDDLICVCCGREIPSGNQYCIICGMETPKKQRQIDRIRNMSVEELAKWLGRNIATHSMPKEVRKIWLSGRMTTTQAWKQWLESEVEGE